MLSCETLNRAIFIPMLQFAIIFLEKRSKRTCIVLITVHFKKGFAKERENALAIFLFSILQGSQRKWHLDQVQLSSIDIIKDSIAMSFYMLDAYCSEIIIRTSVLLLWLVLVSLPNHYFIVLPLLLSLFLSCSIYLSVYVTIYLFTYASVYLSV